jgi:hypothetical protein
MSWHGSIAVGTPVAPATEMPGADVSLGAGVLTGAGVSVGAGVLTGAGVSVGAGVVTAVAVAAEELQAPTTNPTSTSAAAPRNQPEICLPTGSGTIWELRPWAREPPIDRFMRGSP